MKKLEILQELPKCGTETGSEQILLERRPSRLAPRKVAANLKLVKNTVSSKGSKMWYLGSFFGEKGPFSF